MKYKIQQKKNQQIQQISVFLLCRGAGNKDAKIIANLVKDDKSS